MSYLGYTLLNNANAIVMQVNNNRTIELTGRICQSLEEASYVTGNKALVIGSPNYANYPPLNPLLGKTDASSACEMVWRENSEQYRASIFYQHYGINLFQGQCWNESYEAAAQTEASKEFHAMPLYPEAGSIQKLDDIYVVKVPS